MDEGRINATEEAPRQTGGDGTVNLIVNSETMKPFAWFAGGIVGACLIISIAAVLIAMAGALYVSGKADRMSTATENQTRYMIQITYWMQRVEVAAEKQGVKLPPPPQQPKE